MIISSATYLIPNLNVFLSITKIIVLSNIIHTSDKQKDKVIGYKRHRRVAKVCW